MATYLSSFIIFIVFSTVSFISTSADDQSNDLFSTFNQLVQDNLKSFQDQMKNGFPALKIPSLNPLILEARDFQEENEKVTVVLQLKKIYIYGLTSFEYKMEKTAQNSISMNLSFPYLNVKGMYKVDGKVFKIFPVYGEGNYLVDIKNARLNLTGAFSEDASKKVVFRANHLFFDYGTVSVRLDNFLGGGSLSKVVEALLPIFGKDILLHIQPGIEERMKPVLNQMINQVIAKENVQPIVRSLFLVYLSLEILNKERSENKTSKLVL